MDSATTYTIGAIAIVALFVADALRAPDYWESFKRGRRRNRTLAYTASSIAVLISLGELSKVVKAVTPDLLGVADYPWMDFVGVFLFAELVNWGLHYIKHNGYLWNFHYQHHISKYYNTLLTCYTHGGEVIISGIFSGACMAMVGFSQEAINAYFLFYSVANTYQHSSANLSLGFLDYLIVSPRYHRVHHSKSHSANYGNTLTVWDIVFRTALFPAREDQKQDIGIKDSGEAYGWWAEFFYFLRAKQNPTRTPRWRQITKIEQS